MRLRALALIVLCGLWSCSGGGGTQGVAAITPTTGTTPVSPTGSAPVAASARFTITVPAQSTTTSSSARTPKYVSPATQSIIITLVSVGGVPYTGNPASIATNLSTLNPACTGTTSLTCTVTAPAVVGSDVFSVVTYDTAQTLPFTTPTGNVLSRATLSVAVVAGPNVVTTPLVLNGVPASFSIAPPAGTAGTAFSAPQAVIIAVKDATGNTIVGSYANPVTLSDGDTSGATTLATSGSDSPSAGQLLSSSDAATLSYTGLAITPVTIGATSSGATAGTGTFTPALSPIGPATLAGGVYVNAFGASAPVTFTPSETGWTNAPYNKTLTATLAGCSTIATATPASGTTFTATLVSGATTNGSCTLTLSDGVGQQLVIPLGYQLFTYISAAAQSFTVPSGVTQVGITAAGAQGGAAVLGSAGGQGGTITALEPVTASAVLTIQVGGTGTAATASVSGTGGYNGGGGGGFSSGQINGGGGGGATDVINGTTTLVVAAGGGGGGYAGGGGNGGGSTANGGGQPGGVDNGGGGGGGSQTAGGTAGTSGQGTDLTPAGSGTLGTGGAGGLGQDGFGGGGGGGGYYGGGGGGGGGSIGTSGGGGGGSSFSTVTASSNAIGGQTGNGSVTISW